MPVAVLGQGVYGAVHLCRANHVDLVGAAIGQGAYGQGGVGFHGQVAGDHQGARGDRGRGAAAGNGRCRIVRLTRGQAAAAVHVY